MEIYGIYDVKQAEFQGRVFLASNDAVVVRGLKTAFAQGRDMEAMYPEDYQLFQLGEMDMDTGKITQGNPKMIARFDVVLANGGA